jgi:hypothetical protein
MQAGEITWVAWGKLSEIRGEEAAADANHWIE